ncbi:hypothetical protein LP421_05450 [Rhizobium sp. RCAM05350]|nr:hypothetical protein LP421_05450 [Rhizobium sp. RCAM05350]
MINIPGFRHRRAFNQKSSRMVSHFCDGETFAAACAGQASDAESEFLFDAQVSVAVKSLEGRIKVAAWKRKPSWYVVANGDEAIDPVLLRQTALRIGAKTTEISGGYMIFLSQPDAIAAVILEASFATRNTDNN